MAFQMHSDGGGSYSGNKADVIYNLDNAIKKLEEIDLDSLRRMVKLDGSDASTSTLITAIEKRIDELKQCKSKFKDDAEKIEDIRNRFNI